jgi:hypothetical protein
MAFATQGVIIDVWSTNMCNFVLVSVITLALLPMLFSKAYYKGIYKMFVNVKAGGAHQEVI